MNRAAYTADDFFLKFEYDLTEFLVPLDDIVHIVEKLPEDARVIGKSKANTRNCYIAVQGAAGIIYLTAHHIYGVETVASDRQKYLPESVKTPGNDWIFAMAFDPETQRAMFLVDSCKIRQKEDSV